MALNFPPNPVDKSIYIDPSSGLKYIFNGSVGGWETAIQPPVICNTDEEPAIELEGFLWWNHPNRMLYVYKGGDWIPIMEAGGSGGLAVPVVCASTPPTPAKEGWLWWDTIGGNLYVYYIDEPNTNVPGDTGDGQWVIVVNNNSSGGGDALAIVSDKTPPSPQDGMIWFNNSTETLNVYDASEQTWNVIGGGSGGNTSIIGSSPIRVSPNIYGGNTVAIDKASTSNQGSVQLAKSGDENSSDRVVTPNFLQTNDSVLPPATTTKLGVVRLAADFTDTNDALTPGVLKANATSEGLGNPVGTVIIFAVDSAPAGYLICNGGQIPAGDEYNELRDLLGTTYGASGTLPDMRGNFIKGYKTGTFGQFESTQVSSGSDVDIDCITMNYCIKY